MTPTQRIDLLCGRIKGRRKPIDKAPETEFRPRKPCAALALSDGTTRFPVPRPCKAWAMEGSRYCGAHKRLESAALVVSSEGGWCVWCGTQGRRYECSRAAGPAIALCAECADAMAREIRR